MQIRGIRLGQALRTIVIVLGCAAAAEAQDIFNPYVWEASPASNIGYVMPGTNGQARLARPYDRSRYVGSQYDGELEVSLVNHPWFQFRDSYTASYIVEAVSFPFDVANAWTAAGTAGLADRRLTMPTGAYEATGRGWRYSPSSEPPPIPSSQVLYLTTPPATFSANGISGQPMGLVTSAYTSSQAFPGIWTRQLLPHTVLKVTVRLHVDTRATSPVLTSFSFVYDMTRGRMMSYPFINGNGGKFGGGMANWDLLFVPETFVGAAPYTYGNTTSWRADSESMGPPPIEIEALPNSFPYGRWRRSLPASAYPASRDDTFLLLNGTYKFPFLPPFAVQSTILRSDRGATPAGYFAVAGASEEFMTFSAAHQGITHRYVIDQNLDLTLINPSERVIYNPSRVDITASNLIFPDCYQFKTVRGFYPTVDEIQAANGAPVPTDLSPTNDPTDASVYRILDGAKLTIKPSAVLYDASIVVEPGGTLVYYPDKLRGRHKIANNGGTIHAIVGGSYPDCTSVAIGTSPSTN